MRFHGPPGPRGSGAPGGVRPPAADDDAGGAWEADESAAPPLPAGERERSGEKRSAERRVVESGALAAPAFPFVFPFPFSSISLSSPPTLPEKPRFSFPLSFPSSFPFPMVEEGEDVA